MSQNSKEAIINAEREVGVDIGDEKEVRIVCVIEEKS